MSNTTITATITLPTADIDAFADANGYFENITDPSDESATIPNPQSRTEFIQEAFVNRTLGWFVADYGKQVREVKNLEVQALVDAKRDELLQAITIS